jgi:hypothetical protein
MTPRKFFVGRAIGFLVVLVVLGIVAAYSHFAKVEPVAPSHDYEPYQATLSGFETCLPHKDTSGPQTLECALGIKTDDGTYYALDFSLLGSQVPPEVHTGIRFAAHGLVTPVERLNNDRWQKYDIVGIFSVTDGASIDTPEQNPPQTPPDNTGGCFVGGCSSEVCSDEPNTVSSCIYREEFACYKTAKCERQASGQCGWTKTPKLLSCLGM